MQIPKYQNWVMRANRDKFLISMLQKYLKINCWQLPSIATYSDTEKGLCSELLFSSGTPFFSKGDEFSDKKFQGEGGQSPKKIALD